MRWKMQWESQSDYLQHYGVKGQKHGVRRYQNEDGSLTAEGREHYGVKGDQRPEKTARDTKKEQKLKARRDRQEKEKNEIKENIKMLKKMAPSMFLATAVMVPLTAIAVHFAGDESKNKPNSFMNRESHSNIKSVMAEHDQFFKDANNIGGNMKYNRKHW